MDIKQSSYQGYIWWSDSQNPEIINGDYQLAIADDVIPFVVEGFLYDKFSKKSVSLKFVDGHYIHNEWQLTDDDFKSDKVDVKMFLGKRMEGKWLKFLQFWEEKSDENNLCENMKTEIPSKLVFIGFKDGE